MTTSVRGVQSGKLATRLWAAIGVLLLVAAALLAGGAQPAEAAASRVDVSTTPAADGSTVVTLSGSGFQYQPNAPGGVYVFFGTVADPTTNAWAPSQGGKSGDSFVYSAAGGSQLLVAFSGGSSADSANAQIGADGTWTAKMTIPGSTFSAVFGDPHSGNSHTAGQVDCLQVMCGIITIGAHGLWNANNESFTPVSFVTASGEVKAGSAAPSFDDDATVVDVPGAEATAAPTAAAETPATDAVETGAPAADAAAEQPAPVTTYIVFGVLAAAVLVLIAAVAVSIVRRRRDRATTAPATSDPRTTQEESA